MCFFSAMFRLFKSDKVPQIFQKEISAVGSMFYEIRFVSRHLPDFYAKNNG